MQTIFPFLRYSDAAAAIAWLVEAFGCERHAVHEAPDGTIAHAELRLGSDVFMLGTAADDFLGMKTPRQLGAVNQGLYVVVEDPDAHYARAKAAGAEIIMEPRDMDTAPASTAPATSKVTSGASAPTGRRPPTRETPASG